MTRLIFRVVGQVQGIGFRFFVRETARRLGVAGWVANSPDGSVEGVAEGARGTLEKFIKEIRAGHPCAIVGDIKTEFIDASRAFENFTIKI